MHYTTPGRRGQHASMEASL